jgi:predicted cupin superfamily sugar epimerase
MVAGEDVPAWARELGMQRHPEGGWYRETWRADSVVQLAGYPGARATATAIYFLLTAADRSAWHVVRSAELWLWHRGGPLTLRLGGDGDRPAEPATVVTVGPRVEDGQVPQAVVPPGVWQSAEPAGGEAVLVSCVVSPGFDFADFRLLDDPRPPSDA